MLTILEKDISKILYFFSFLLLFILCKHVFEFLSHGIWKSWCVNFIIKIVKVPMWVGWLERVSILTFFIWTFSLKQVKTFLRLCGPMVSGTINRHWNDHLWYIFEKTFSELLLQPYLPLKLFHQCLFVRAEISES